MSKAFTKEDDLALPELPKPVALRPPGTRNLITPAGEARLRAELAALDAQRAPLVSAPVEDTDSKHQLQVLDRKIQQLQQSLAQAELVPPPPPDARGSVQFGATVTLREPDGSQSVYQIVGVDEADFDVGRISWLSPLARALMQTRAGQRVSFHAPAGLRELEIIDVRYPESVAADEVDETQRAVAN